MIRRNILIAVAGLVIFGAFSYYVKENIRQESSVTYSRGDVIESFTLQNLEGGEVALDSVLSEHKYVWINFWATWCGPCRREMPMMAQLYEEYHYRGLEILAVDVAEEKATVEEYVNQNELPFPVLLDTDGALAESMNIRGLPTSFLVDSTGVIEHVVFGYDESWQFRLGSLFNNNR